MFYVQVIGSYDCTVVGPFPGLAAAKQFKETVPQNFDAYVMTEAELDKNFAEFGPCEVEFPEQYGFDSVNAFTGNR